MQIEFKKEKKTLEVKTNKGELVKYEIELRNDPLTGRLSILCPHLQDKWEKFYASEAKEWLNKQIEDSRKQCIFCLPIIDNIAAKFTESQMPKELYRNGDVYIFPNLFPRTSFEAIVTNPLVHSLDFTMDLSNFFYDFISSAIDCINEAYCKNSDLKHVVIGCNYLPPAGASLMHYHMQISMQEMAFHRIKLLMDKSHEYYSKSGNNYWIDLVNTDKERVVIQEGNVYWYVPFAPLGFSEVRAMIDKPVLTDFSTEDIRNLASGIYKILAYYNHKGYNSFNFIIYSGMLDKYEEHFKCGVSIVARSNYCPDYLSIDSWYMPYLLEQVVVLEKPEKLALRLREKW